MRRAGLLLGTTAFALAEREGAVRLIDPSDPELKDTIPWGRKWWMGRAFPQIYYQGEWGAVCGGTSVTADTQHAMGVLFCEQTSGKAFKRIKQLPLEFFPMVTGGAGRIWMDAYQCPVGVKCLGECVHALDLGAYSAGCRAIAVECEDTPAAAAPSAADCGVARAKSCPDLTSTICPGFSAVPNCLDADTTPPHANKCKATHLDTVACSGLTVGKCYKTAPGPSARAPLYCESTLSCERMGYSDLNRNGCKRAAATGTDRCKGGTGTFDELTGQEVMSFMDNGILPSIGCSRVPKDLARLRDMSTPIITGIAGTAHTTGGAGFDGNLGGGNAVTGGQWTAAVGDVPSWYVHCAQNDLYWFTHPMGRGRPCGGTRAMCICSCNKYDEYGAAAPGCDEDGKIRIRRADDVLQVCHDGKWGHVCGSGLFVDQSNVLQTDGSPVGSRIQGSRNSPPTPFLAHVNQGFGRFVESPTQPADHAVPIANIACAQAEGLAPKQIFQSKVAPHGDKIWLDNLRCPSDGSATHLTDCLWGSGWGEVSANCFLVGLICDDSRGPVPRPSGSPKVIRHPQVCPRVFALSVDGRVGADNPAPGYPLMSASLARTQRDGFHPWNVRVSRQDIPTTAPTTSAAPVRAPSLSPTRAPAKAVHIFGRTRAPTEFPTVTGFVATQAPSLGGARLRIIDPTGWSELTGCPLVAPSDDPPNCLDRASVMGATCKSAVGECGTKAGFCYRVGPSPAQGARFCESTGPCESNNYSPVESEAECESAMFMGTNRCFSGGTGATFRSGLEVLGGIWASANEWTGSDMFGQGGRDVQDSMVRTVNEPGPTGRTHSLTNAENLAGAGVNTAPRLLADGRTNQDFAAWGLGLYPTGCFRTMGRHTFGSLARTGAGPVPGDAGDSGFTTGPMGTLYGASIMGHDMDTYCTLFSNFAWLPAGAAGWDVGRECGVAGLPCVCKCTPPTKAPTPAPVEVAKEVQQKIEQQEEQEQVPAKEEQVGKEKHAVNAVCAKWCTAGKHAGTSWKKKCGWGGCAPCAECAPTKAPTRGVGPRDGEACFTFCKNHRHEGTPWKIKCTWSTCSACPPCKPTEPPTPAPCMAFCKRTSGNWEKKCADWANCKGCPCCKGDAAACDEPEQVVEQAKGVQKKESPPQKQVTKNKVPQQQEAPKSMK